ncbi:hypothetical protein L1887_37954 [Cichorium endivia]|nr:hypothetical protein L1887_37954 [Cichorium endivia]
MIKKLLFLLLFGSFEEREEIQIIKVLTFYLPSSQWGTTCDNNGSASIHPFINRFTRITIPRNTSKIPKIPNPKLLFPMHV